MLFIKQISSFWLWRRNWCWLLLLFYCSLKRLGWLLSCLFFGWLRLGWNIGCAVVFFDESVMAIGMIFVSFPGYSGCFYYDSILEGRQFSLEIGEVEPCDCIVIHDFKPKNVWTLERKTIIDMLQSYIIFAHHDSKHIGSFLVIIVLWYEVIYQSHFLLRHLSNNCRPLLLNVYYKFNLLIQYCIV